jgi:carbon-monoxide dehydrogenase large subunit
METVSMDSDGRLVGTAVPRAEDDRFLRGAGVFVDDLDPAGVLHAVILRSSIPHGTLIAIDAAAALAIPGVRAVFTAADLGEDIPVIPMRLAPMPDYIPFLQPVLARDKVRFVGEALAVVVADTAALAEDALEAISVDIAPLPVAVKHGDPTLLFEDARSNTALRYTASRGDPGAAFAEADYLRKEHFSSHRMTALPMETRGLLATWDAASERLIIEGASKVLFFNRRTLAKMMALPESAIDLLEVDVGGGFGVRGEFYPEDFLVPFAARKLGCAVKWIEDRREHLLATNHSREIECELEIACRRDGTILGLRGIIRGDMGAYIRTNGGVVPAKAAQFLPGPYRIAHVGVEVEAFMTNKTPTGTYRAPGRFEANFFRERLLDMVAADLGIDRVDFRRRNLITEAELPYVTGVLVPYEPDSAFDTGDYHATLDRALAEIRWSQREALQGRGPDGRFYGLGLAPFVESSAAGPREHARLVIEPNGTVTIFVGSSALGQGIETTFAQIAGDALNLPMSQLTVRHGSTTFVHEGFGTYHSRALVVGGSAVLDGCEKLLAALHEAARERLGRPNADIAVSGGKVWAGDSERLSLASFAGLSANGVFDSVHRTYSYGAHACWLAVDPRTGGIDILDYVAVEDVGVAVNPAIVHGQAIGAVVQGLGGVFLDHLIYDENAQLVNASLADYLVPTATDFPKVRAVTLELRRSPSNPLGAKGAGEGGIVSVAAAVGNAVAAALDISVNSLPLSPGVVWAMAEAKEKRAVLF